MTQIIIKNVVAIDERNDNAPGSVLISFNHDDYLHLQRAQEQVAQCGYLAIDVPVKCSVIWHPLSLALDEHDWGAPLDEHKAAFAAFHDNESQQQIETTCERFHVTEYGITLIAELKDSNATSAFETREISLFELRTAVLLASVSS